MSIKELRIQKGWSQEYLAQITNLSTRTIQRIEKENKASIESTNALAQAFKLEINELKDILLEEEYEHTSTNETHHNNFYDFLKEDRSVIKFVFINLMLLCINIFSGLETIWFIYPLLGWGIPLIYSKYKSYSNKV